MVWGDKGTVFLCWAFFLALGLHLAVAIFWADHYSESGKQADEQPLWIDFYVHGSDKRYENRTGLPVKGEKKKRFKAGVGLGAGNRSVGAHSVSQLLPLPTPIANPEVRSRLEAVERKLEFYWDKVRPEQQGEVVLRIKVGRHGELLALWVLQDRGYGGLSRTVLDLVRAAAPFQRAIGPGPLVFDCSFVVN